MRLAIIGLGEVADTIQLPALRRLPETELVAAVERNERLGRSCAAKWQIPRLYTNAPEMLENEQPDVVTICTPPDSHAELCLAALAASAHVVCEKPFVCSLKEADAVIAMAAHVGRQVALNNQYPRMPIFAVAKAFLDTPAFGELLSIQAWQLLYQPTWEEAGWRSQLRHRTLFEFGNHVVDLLCDFFAAYPSAVFSATGGSRGDASCDLIHSLHLEFPGQRLATVLLHRLSRARQHYLEMRLDGTEGALRISLGGRAEVRLGLHPATWKPYLHFDVAKGGQCWWERGERRRVLARNSFTPFVDATVVHLREVLRCLREGKEPPKSAQHSRKILEIIFSAYCSASCGEVVKIGSETAALQDFSVRWA